MPIMVTATAMAMALKACASLVRLGGGPPEGSGPAFLVVAQRRAPSDSLQTLERPTRTSAYAGQDSVAKTASCALQTPSGGLAMYCCTL